MSSLDRCLQTAQLTCSGVNLPLDRPFNPVVKKMLRDCIGIHTCDRRSNKTYIQSTYPYEIEPRFAKEDPLWLPDLRESNSALTVRLKHFLDDIFTHSSDMVFSLTSRGGAVAAILRAIGHRDFPLKTGAVIKAEIFYGEEPEASVDQWEPKSEC